jgi:hypothetical protein
MYMAIQQFVWLSSCASLKCYYGVNTDTILVKKKKNNGICEKGNFVCQNARAMLTLMLIRMRCEGQPSDITEGPSSSPF